MRISISSDKIGTIAQERLRPIKSVPIITSASEFGKPSKELGPRHAFWIIINMKETKITNFLLA